MYSHVRDTAGTQVLVKSNNKMSSVLVRCYCQVCHGKFVSRYVRRRHVEMYVDRVSAPLPKKVAYDLMPLCHGTTPPPKEVACELPVQQRSTSPTKKLVCDSILLQQTTRPDCSVREKS